MNKYKTIDINGNAFYVVNENMFSTVGVIKSLLDLIVCNKEEVYKFESYPEAYESPAYTVYADGTFSGKPWWIF